MVHYTISTHVTILGNLGSQQTGYNKKLFKATCGKSKKTEELFKVNLEKKNKKKQRDILDSPFLLWNKIVSIAVTALDTTKKNAVESFMTLRLSWNRKGSFLLGLYIRDQEEDG